MDKKASDWYFPCINRHYSKMSFDDWTSTPNSSNITESVHVETNCHMGTHLSLLERIDRYVLIIAFNCACLGTKLNI